MDFEESSRSKTTPTIFKVGESIVVEGAIFVVIKFLLRKVFPALKNTRG
jgi:hypothetical protein